MMLNIKRPAMTALSSKASVIALQLSHNCADMLQGARR
jgi:hypothetical protein